jgi:two-component system chemotaxis sensor kinase CheA
LPETIVTDPQRLRQILKNLLANAFKFTERGEVSVHVGLADRRLEPGRVALGRAVRRRLLRQRHRHRHRRRAAAPDLRGLRAGRRHDRPHYGGTGLGLSISRELVGLLGGEITVTAPGQGSTFTVFLPSALWPLTPPTLQAGTLAGRRALVVDDDLRNTFALSALLNGDSTSRSSRQKAAKQGVATLQQNPDVDLVLVDIMMPGMDGYETMRAMRKLPSGEDLTLIAFTAKVSADERQRCADAGASAYVPKPVDTAQLLLVLSEWLPIGIPVGASVNGAR